MARITEVEVPIKLVDATTGEPYNFMLPIEQTVQAYIDAGKPYGNDGLSRWLIEQHEAKKATPIDKVMPMP